ncbi:E3 ubiquitin-protein ligase rnf168-like [Leptidea sinapis]|uniref:E3 ubiquitin-protein ligase rnf168-like n=1 Tax=Leptidea sinapis TaxID=189913 RepID=UPI0021C27EA4|nr:E3 ubiquitin-protein ligase rnf168-like [Leptidea sinapis]
MAAKSSKRLFKNENKLIKLDKLEYRDVICSICQSILIEPVTLPCYHDFCHHCFRGTIENNALCCPLCRLRIGSWLRTSTKKRALLNFRLWDFIQNKFSEEVSQKLRGDDKCISPETPIPRLSEPGEIRSEYEAELQRLRAERLKLEQKHIHETQILVQRLKQEEEEAHKKYLESLKSDEILAKKLQHGMDKNNFELSKKKKVNKKILKPRLKSVTIDSYMPNLRSQVNGTSVSAEDKDTNELNSRMPSNLENNTKPEPQNSSSKILNFLDVRVKDAWNKENGKNLKIKESAIQNSKEINDKTTKTKNGIQSLLVSLPLPSLKLIPHKSKVVEKRTIETGSVDSMQQELCYFKPIEETITTSYKPNNCLPLRVPGLRLENGTKTLKHNDNPPSRSQYIDSLCHLRSTSLAQRLPSAFVIALSKLWSKEVFMT